MTNKQILRRLNDIKMDGINYLRNYHYNGDITFNLNKSFNSGFKNITNIKMKKEDDFRAVIISDLHVGSELERLDLLYQVYDYCNKNNINGYFTNCNKYNIKALGFYLKMGGVITCLEDKDQSKEAHQYFIEFKKR